MSVMSILRSRAMTVAVVWLARFLIGGLFIISGLSKAVDLWGFVYKIEEYLKVWDFVQPRSLVFIAALAVSGAEFVLGALLLFGLYRRSAPVLLALMMCGLLPLTLYIYIASPVADCGCFGDLLILSNAATFWKNVVITVVLLWQIKFNLRVEGLFSVPVQWLVGAVLSLYVIIVGLVGFNVQPMMDFRSFPAGTSLAGADDDDGADAATVFEFIYRNKAGDERVLSADSLPGDEWTFVDRRQIAGRDAEARDATEFVIIDDGDDITSEVISVEGEEILLLIPDLSRADVTYTFALNELNGMLLQRGGTMAALIGSGSDGLELWSDLSMASYPLYSAEPTLIKELARGNMSLVYLKDGVVVWKRTLSSIRPQTLLDADRDDDTFLDSLDPETYNVFLWLSGGTMALLFVLWLLDRSGRLIGLHLQRRILRKKSGGFSSSSGRASMSPRSHDTSATSSSTKTNK